MRAGIIFLNMTNNIFSHLQIGCSSVLAQTSHYTEQCVCSCSLNYSRDDFPFSKRILNLYVTFFFFN